MKPSPKTSRLITHCASLTDLVFHLDVSPLTTHCASLTGLVFHLDASPLTTHCASLTGLVFHLDASPLSLTTHCASLTGLVFHLDPSLQHCSLCCYHLTFPLSGHIPCWWFKQCVDKNPPFIWPYSLMVSSSSSHWILMSCQPNRITSGQSNSGHKQIHISKLFSHIYNYTNPLSRQSTKPITSQT